MQKSPKLYVLRILNFLKQKKQVYKPGSVSNDHLSVAVHYCIAQAISRRVPSRLNSAVDVAPDGVYTGLQLPSSL